MRRICMTLGLCVSLSVPCLSQEATELFTAARSGDVAAVASILDYGVDIDSVDQYGITALSMAAGNGRLEIVKLLLDRGADPNIEEQFYYSTALDSALDNEQFEVAEILLQSGAESREAALRYAVQNDLPGLARAVVGSGPLYKSDLDQLRHSSELDPAMVEVLAEASSRADPEAPNYSAEELIAYTGRFEGWDTSTVVDVVLRERTLLIAIDGGAMQELEPYREDRFGTKDESVDASFFGRAGLIEGFALTKAGVEPIRVRRSVAEPVSAASLNLGQTSESAVESPIVHWPSFRGDNGGGIGDGIDTPISWNLESGESVLWRIDLPGLGNSSPVIWGDKLFITTAVAKDVEQTIRTGLTGSGEGVDEAVPHRWVVMAFDKKTGSELWQTDVGSGVPITERHFKATQANSTPATDGKHLVVVFPTAGLACLDLDGTILWKHDLGGLNAGAFTNPEIEWGYASSPIILGSMAILQIDIHGGAYLAAWDLETGKELWRTERDVAPSWATPSLLRAKTGDELIVNGSTIHGYDPATGQELWSLGPNSELVIATPVIGDNIAYVSAGYPPVKPIYAVRAGTRGELEVEPGVDHESLLWSQQRGGAYMPSPILYRGMLFIIHHNGRMVVYDAKTGAAIHKSRFSQGGVFTGSPVAVNGKIYAPTEEGLVYVLNANPDFGELAVNEMGEPVMATPAVTEGILVIRTPSHLTAIAHGAR